MSGLFTALLSRPYLIAIVLAAAGMYLMLPPGSNRRRIAGGVLNLAAVGCFCSQLVPLGSWNAQTVFWMLSAVTLVSAVATVTSRNPVYSALWFGMTLLGTAGLFLFVGAQFLAVATLVVYAGAILVTFLFVLMLATPTGSALCDRLTFEPLLSAATGAVLVGMLAMTLRGAPPAEPVSPAALRTEILANEHMAQLGGQLFGRHLVAVEVAGALLMVALVGATAIVAHGKSAGPGAGPPTIVPDAPVK